MICHWDFKTRKINKKIGGHYASKPKVAYLKHTNPQSFGSTQETIFTMNSSAV